MWRGRLELNDASTREPWASALAEDLHIGEIFRASPADPERLPERHGRDAIPTLSMTTDMYPPVSLLWRRLDHPGLEHFTHAVAARGPILEGIVISLPGDSPLRVDYRIECTPDWHTKQVVVTMQHGTRRQLIELTRDDQCRWQRAGASVPELDGCEDIDLSVTPSTNTLPIHRLALEIGRSSEVTSAWIRFPSCEITPLPQRYTRAGEYLYRYESRGGEFSAELTVDEYGMVLDYPPAWERVGR